MNVLWLTHPESDYGAAFFYSGMCRNLGADHVFDYPIKPTYHGQDDNNYPRPWCSDGPGNTGRYEWLKEGCPLADKHLSKPGSEVFVKSLLEDGFFDLVVLESWRWTVQQSWSELKDAIGNSGAKVILHDGEDFSNFNIDALETVQPDFYLKRELLKGYDFSNQSGPVVLPFPFSAPDQIVEWADAQPSAVIERDIACLLGLSWQPRQELADELRRGMEAGEYTGYVATNHETREPGNWIGQHPLLGFWDYLEVLRTSRFGFSMRGWGEDTCRAWETAVLTGLFMDELNIQIPNNFEHSINAWFYKDVREAREIARNSAYHMGAWEIIRDNGIAHARKYHTNSARVKWLLEAIL